MIEHLKLILKNAILEEKEALLNNNLKILQYEFPSKEILTFNANLLTQEQVQLLNVFLKPVKHLNNTDQRFWKTLVEENQVIGELPVQTDEFRFIHFHINGTLQDEIEFEDALKSYFPENVTFVWNNNSEGFIVEYISDKKMEDYCDSSITEAIMSDFYIKLSIFQGTRFCELEEAKEIYTWEVSTFSLARRILPNLNVIQKEQLIPFILTNGISDMTKKVLLQTINSFQGDKELLRTIKIFFECNLNTTLAAKKLYMHRNSLQYRIDKFIEKTGIDIRQFQQAAAMYMLLTLEEINRK
ncbi:hypothetical protein BKP37_15750 [Anaerobacillus alkalilacustris]|uniref:PucR C-terminal helix-turn-helix domain-containing protein n=1 Tax=Anaerobacillus alkalilacustris TaxID=393763 RepID=A0A1S2LGA4_9BACI|nr:helix-turn-helix domain-containing protein [Anaerobacillus alkalilacustris]OIJ11406.1 hypothetical protein BKP37_15750 [Anaerobacillus alkalilacustris]